MSKNICVCVWKLQSLSWSWHCDGQFRNSYSHNTGQGCPSNRPRRPRGYSSTLSWPRHIDGCGWSAPRPGRFTPGKDPVPIVQEAGWAPGPLWTGAENVAHTGIRSSDRPARSESLYRLSYPSPYSHSTEWSVRMVDVNKRKAPWKHGIKLCIAHLLPVLIILWCLLWDGHCACGHGGSTFPRLYAIRFVCVGIVKNVYGQRHTLWWLILNVAATFSQVITWEEQDARWLSVEV